MEFGHMGPFHWLLTICIGLVAAWFVKRIIFRPRDLPPGPSGLPLLGVALKLIGSDMFLLFLSWADKYGDIMSFNVGPKLIVLLSSYDLVSEAWRHPNLQNRPKSQIMKEISGAGQNGVLLASGETWREQRKFIHYVFRSLGVGKKSYEDTVAAEMSQLGTAIEEKMGSPFDPSILFGQAVSNIICSIVFGTHYKYSDIDFKHILDLLHRNLELFGSGSWIFFLPLPGISKIPFRNIKALVSNTRELNAFIRNMIENHEMNFDPEHPKDFIDQYLSMLHETQGKDSTFSLLNLESAIKDLFFAGTETTATTLKWCIMFMMGYPEVQSRVQAELDHVVGRNRLSKLDDSKNLPYTNAVLMEAQRKAAVVPLGLPHVAAAETVIKGYTIPKGATIIANLRHVLNREDFWEDTDAFRPERFLDEDGNFIKREELIFFSTGRRVCLGEKLARMETFLGFTSLLQRFTFKKADNSPPLSFAGVTGGTRNTAPYHTCAIVRGSK